MNKLKPSASTLNFVFIAADNLVPKPTLMDAVALTRTGYPKSTACDGPGLENDVFTTTAEPWGQANTSTSWSSTNRYNVARSSSVPGDGGSTSTLEDEFEFDWAKMITTELTELDRDIVKFVATGGEITNLPDASLEVLLNGDSLDGLKSNEAIQNLVTPKIEEIPMDIEGNGIAPVNLVNVQNVPPPRVPNGGYGNLPMDNFTGDTKPNLISMNQEGDLLETGLAITGSKIRGINSPCMFGSGSSTGERNYQQKAPSLSHVNSAGPSNAAMMSITQQTKNLPTGRNPNGMKASPSRNFERIPQQADMASTGGGNFRVPVPVSQMPNQNDAVVSQFFPILKEALPNFSDETVADLIFDMMQDSAKRTAAQTMRMKTILQESGLAQLEEVPEIEIKQEVVTPTLPQPTSSFPSFSDSVANQSNQPQVKSGPTSFSSTDTFNQVPGNHATFVTPPRRPQNGTVLNQNSPMRFQTGNSQFESQGDSNMNFLNSFASAGVTSTQTGVPLPSDNLWSPDPPLKQNVMDQGIRNLLQSTGNPLPNPNTNLNSQMNSGLLPQQSNVQFVPQSLSNMLPQNGSRNTQSHLFNMTVDQLNPQELSHMNSLLQSGAPLQASSFQNLNGASMSITNQHYPKFDMNRKL